MSLWKNYALFLIIWKHYFGFLLDALFGLTWHMLTTCLTHTKSPEASMIIYFWLLMPSYASLNDVLSLCMIMAIIALLVARSQSFASPHFILSMSSTHASNSRKPSCSNVSTINSYAWYLQAIPSKFLCATFRNLQNTSRLVTLFLAHGDVVVGFAIFHIVYSKKKALLHGMWMLVGTRWNRLAMVWERKKGGEECQAL
jgi:hypothetical protein